MSRNSPNTGTSIASKDDKEFKKMGDKGEDVSLPVSDGLPRAASKA